MNANRYYFGNRQVTQAQGMQLIASDLFEWYWIYDQCFINTKRS
jgi:hypothetical protein